MDKSFINTISAFAAVVTALGVFATMMVVIFRTGKRLGEAENKIGNLELITRETHDELQDARIEELTKDVHHVQNRELSEIREDIKELKLDIREKEDDLEKKIEELKKEVGEKEDDLEKRIDELKHLIGEKEDDLEKRIDYMHSQFREDIRESRSDIKDIESDIKELTLASRIND